MARWLLGLYLIGFGAWLIRYRDRVVDVNLQRLLNGRPSTQRRMPRPEEWARATRTMAVGFGAFSIFMGVVVLVVGVET